MDAISKQGKRTDLINEINRLSSPDKIEENSTSDRNGQKLLSRDITAEKYGLSTTNVSRYIRLNYLIKPLLKRVDSGAIGFTPAISLSFLSHDEQMELSTLLDEMIDIYKIDVKAAENLLEASKSKKLIKKVIEQILTGEVKRKHKSKLPTSFTIKRKTYLKYFENMKLSEVESIVNEALEEYFEKRKDI
jgi:ParB family chromosome partitioning protein